MRAVFGPFSFDLCTLELIREGINLRIEEKPARMLSSLIERRGEIVSREELRKRLWPEDVNVDFDHGLNKAANKLRAVLCDRAAAPRYLETLSRRGYRFIHPVELVATREAWPLDPIIATREERKAVDVPEVPLVSAVATLEPAKRRLDIRALILLLAVSASLVAFVPGAGTLVHFPGLKHPQHIVLPEGLNPMVVGDGTLSLSPDGARAVFAAAGKEGQPRLWLLDLKNAQTKELPGTEGGSMPFWSPEGSRLGFFTQFELKTIDLTSYAIKVLAPVSSARGGDWSPKGVILFAPGTRGAIFRIPMEGGTPVPVSAVNAKAGASTNRWPRFLPDGSHFVYFEANHRQPEAAGKVMLASMDGGDAHFLVESDSNAIPTGDRLAFVSHGKLLAVPLRNLKAETGAKVLADGIECDRGSWYCGFDINANGALYRPHNAAADQETIAWFDAQGNRIANLGASGVYRSVDLSPDGKTVAVTCGDPDEKTCLFREDGSVTRLDSLGIVSGVVWAPDSSAIGYLDHQTDTDFSFQIKPLLQPLPARTIYTSKTELYPVAWHPGGRYMLFSRALSDGRFDAGVLDLKTGETMPYLPPDPFRIDLPRFSPDGKWVAFAKQTGRMTQIYLASFPVPTELMLLTTEGGCAPKWRGDGRAIYYLGPNGNLFSVSLTPAESGFRVGTPTALFHPPIFYAPWDRVSFDVTRSGERFVINSVEFPKSQELVSTSF